MKRVLAIETSCDDTSVAVVRQDGWVEAMLAANQDTVHAPFGGVVPEIASRNHTLNILPLLEQCLQKSGLDWKDIDGLAVTNRPGLIGSLLVGLTVAKSIAQIKQLPWIAVNHLEGHIMAPFLRDADYQPLVDFTFPFLALAVSGGHTSLYEVQAFGQYKILGSTLDDAAGEAFDKFAKMLGLGFPGGAQVDRWAQGGNPTAFAFPRALLNEDNCMFSFSGLKASAQRQIEKLAVGRNKDWDDQLRADLCASYQTAIVEVLLHKLQRAVRLTQIKNVVITGGVGANSQLRAQAQAWAHQAAVQLLIPPLRYCTDNAAMIGFVGITRLQKGQSSDLSVGPSPSSWPGDFC